MAKGLPKWAIKEAKRRGAKNIFAYAWTLVKRKGRSRSRKVTKTKNPKRRVRKTARKKRKRTYQMTIPLAPMAGLAAGLAKPISLAIQGPEYFETAMHTLCMNYTGFHPADGTWTVGRLRMGLLPLVVGCLVHKFVGGPPLNLNKVLARAKVPFIRI